MPTTMIYYHQLITTRKIDEIHKIPARLLHHLVIWPDLLRKLVMVIARKNHLVEGETFFKSTEDEAVLWTNTRSINTLKAQVHQIHLIVVQTIVAPRKGTLRRCVTDAQTSR